MNILQGVIDKNVEHASFSQVSGDQCNVNWDTQAPRSTPIRFSAPGMHVLSDAEVTNVRFATFNEVDGVQYSNAAAHLSVQLPAEPAVDRHGMHVLAGAKRTDARRAVFSSVSGNQYGLPQSQTQATTARNVEERYQNYREEEYQSLC